jgi:DNA (cytosine-5)-methyltransferase 1
MNAQNVGTDTKMITRKIEYNENRELSDMVKKIAKYQPTVISTFAGGGGSSLGYHWAGYKELLAIDFDQNSCDTLKANFDFPVWQRDIKEVTPEEILSFCKIKKGELDVLDGSPPCQGFSTAGKRIVSDDRNTLFLEYVRLIKGLQPKVFIMENVSGMMKGTMKGIFNEILEILKGTGYIVKCKLMNAMWYEVPQSRERLIFIGVRKDIGKEPIFPVPGKKVITVKEALKGIQNNEMPPNLSTCFLKLIPEMKQGQSMNDVSQENKHFQTIRIYANKVCPTITKIIGGIGFGSLIHPFENRVFSINELLRFCSFPDNYKLFGSYQERKARLGNAVMPKMMFHIAKEIRCLL